VLKLPIKRFGSKAKSIQEIYPEAKMLVFSTEPWQLTGMHAAEVNESIIYALCKHQNEYLIVAERRLGEL